MPVPAEFTWSETLDSVAFAIKLPSSSTRSWSTVRHGKGNRASTAVDFIISPFYVKLSALPYFFEADLFEEIEPETSTFRHTPANAEGHFHLKKKKPCFWRHYSATHNLQLNAEEIRSRRVQSLEVYENEQKEKRKREKNTRYQRQKTSQEEQWRIDRDTKEWLEKKKEEEKRDAIQRIFNSADKRTSTVTTVRECERETDVRNLSSTEDCTPSNDSTDEEEGPRIHEIEAEEHEVDEGPPQCSAFTVNEGDASTYEAAVTPASGGMARSTSATSDNAETAPSFVAPPEDVIVSSAPLAPQAPPANGGTLSMTASALQHCEDGECESKGFIGAGPKKVTLNFTTRKHYRLPARGDKVPPFPKNVAQASRTKDAQNAGSKLPHERDQQWLKDKGSQLLKNGDLCGAVEAYTEALKASAEDVDCLANRSYAYLMLGNLDKCIEDCQQALRTIDESTKVPKGYPAPPLSPHRSRVRMILNNRLAVCCTWKGCFDQAELYFSQTIGSMEEAGHLEDLEQVRQDYLRFKGLRDMLETKLKADFLLRGPFKSEAPCSDGSSGSCGLPIGEGTGAAGEPGTYDFVEAKRLYTVIHEWAKPINHYGFLAALSLSNRALASLRREEPEEALKDSTEALQYFQNMNIVLEKSLRATPEGCGWCRAPAFSAGEWQKSSSHEEPSGGGSDESRALVVR